VRPGSSSMASIMLTAMLIMTFAFWAYCVAAAMHRLRTQIIEREAETKWVKELVK
jgi:heme exporter protein C